LRSLSHKMAEEAPEGANVEDMTTWGAAVLLTAAFLTPEPPAEQPKVKPCEFCGGPMVPGDGHRMGPKTGGPWLVCRHCGAQRPAPSPEEPTP
jgi:hypothetical protein